MVYKDKDKQREANRQAQARFKAKKVLPKQGITEKVLPKYPRVSDQDFTRRLATLPPGSPNVRVSKPGDADYEPQCETTKAFIEDRPKVKPEDVIGLVKVNPCYNSIKRGLDIKCFEDLPLDVQETIRTISESNEEFQRRTGIAIRYQHLFPERYHSTGAAQ